MPRGELTSRLLVAVIGIPLAALIIYGGVWPLGMLMAVMGALGAREYYSLTRDEAVAFGWLGAALAGALPLIAALHPDYRAFAPWAFTLVLGTALLALALSLWLRWPDGRPLDAAARTIMGALYTGGALSFWVLLRALPDQVSDGATAFHGAALLIFPIWVTWLGTPSPMAVDPGGQGETHRGRESQQDGRGGHWGAGGVRNGRRCVRSTLAFGSP